MTRHFALACVALLFLVLSPPASAQRQGRDTDVVSNSTYQNTHSVAPSSVQHASDEHPVIFKSETVLIQVPVIVTDKTGNHVRGLSQSDFELRESGREQKISNLEEIVTNRNPLSASPRRAGEFSNTAIVGDTPRAITIVALDTINTPYLDQTYGRQQLLKYLADNVQPGSAMALVSMGSHGVRTIHELTSEPGELIEALKKVTGEAPALQGVDLDAQAAAATGANRLSVSTTGNLRDFIAHGDALLAGLQQDRAIEATMKAFLEIAWSVKGVTGKKSLIWATGGFPFQADSPSAVPGGYLSTLYERALRALNDSEISVYPIDVRGLVTLIPINKTRIGGTPENSYAESLAARAWLQTSTIDSLKDFADMTGGHAFYNHNDLADSFKRATEDATDYYLLSYYLDTKNVKPGWRQLKVKVRRPGTEVRARSGFFVTNAAINPDVTHQMDITFALTSPLDGTGIPLSVHWKTTSTDGDKKKILFGLHVFPAGVTIEGEPGQLDLDVAIVAFATKSGKAATTMSKSLAGTANAARVNSIRAEGFGYSDALELPPGEYNVRFVVRDNPTGRIGSVSAPLTVN